MNIFVTNDDPTISAVSLDDRRLIKMILESAQMMSTAMHVHDALNPPYKITHKNHPCAVWTQTTKQNYLWLFDHFAAMCHEYTKRYGKTHKCWGLASTFLSGANSIPDGTLTQFANCSKFQEIETLLAYRLTMISKWADDKEKGKPPRWTKSSPPSWFLV